VNEPVDVDDVVPTVKVEVAVPPDAGVTGPGRLIETSVGALPIQEYVKETAELKALVEPTVIVDIWLSP
jgi:hypothetical protein